MYLDEGFLYKIKKIFENLLIDSKLLQYCYNFAKQNWAKWRYVIVISCTFMTLHSPYITAGLLPRFGLKYILTNLLQSLNSFSILLTYNKRSIILLLLLLSAFWMFLLVWGLINPLFSSSDKFSSQWSLL